MIEDVQQRIHYLIEHGGIYPERPQVSGSLRWALLGLALLLVVDIALDCYAAFGP